jgi:hypothetical protein
MTQTVLKQLSVEVDGQISRMSHAGSMIKIPGIKVH